MTKSCIVKDYMSASVITFTPDMAILDAIHKLVANRISGAPVLDERGNVIGMLSEHDCLSVALQAGYYGDAGGRVGQFMSTGVEAVDASMSIVDLAQRFVHSSYRRYPVMTDQRLVGQISRHDVLRALQDLALS